MSFGASSKMDDNKKNSNIKLVLINHIADRIAVTSATCVYSFSSAL